VARQLGGINNVRCTKCLSPVQLLGVNINGNNLASTSQLGTGNRCHAHAAQAKDGDGFTALDISGIDRCTESCHDAAAEESSRCWICFRVNLGALAFVRSEEHTSELQSRFDLVCRLRL